MKREDAVREFGLMPHGTWCRICAKWLGDHICHGCNAIVCGDCRTSHEGRLSIVEPDSTGGVSISSTGALSHLESRP